MKLASQNKVLLFPITVYKFNVENFDQQKFAKFAIRLQDICQSQLRSGTGWQSPSDIHDVNKYFKEKEDIDCITEILSMLTFGINKLAEDYEFEKLNLDLEARISSLWFNINHSGTFNEMHNHGTSGYSGVFYVQKNENQGDIMFEDIRRESKLWMVPNAFFKNDNWIREKIFGTKEIDARTGDVLMFPSWVDHLVDINRTPELRISVSFNFNWYEK